MTDGQINFLLQSNRMKLRHLRAKMRTCKPELFNGLCEKANTLRADIENLTSKRAELKVQKEKYVYLAFDKDGDYIGTAKDEAELEDIKTQVDVAKVKKERAI